MKLTEKDKQFVERLKELVDKKILWIEYVAGSPGHFVLRGNYGTLISKKFGISRQGVRWRFWKLMNAAYISAYECVLFVEKNFGPQLRQDAMEIARQRFQLRQEMLKDPFFKEANTYHGKDED